MSIVRCTAYPFRYAEEAYAESADEADALELFDSRTARGAKEPDPNARYQSYYWRDTHEGIIDRKTWEKAQEVVEARRKDLQMGVDRKGKETHFLYGKVFCASCGAPYKRRTLPHKRVEGETVYHKVWNCRERQKGPKGNGCRNNFIREEELLRKVSDQLGWEWKGADDFDAETTPSHCLSPCQAPVSSLLFNARKGSEA